MSTQISDDQVEIFKSVFRGRTDTFLTSRRIKRAITDQDLRRHLLGKCRIAQYPLSPDILDGTGTYWVAADIDIKPCQEFGVDPLGMAVEASGVLDELGVKAYIERSKSGGCHVIVFFDEPVLARKARLLVFHATDAVEEKTDFRIGEIFPKQDDLSRVEFGSCLNLPLFGTDVQEEGTVFLDPGNDYKPYPDQWEFLKSIEKTSPGKIDDLIASGELKHESDHENPGDNNGAMARAKGYDAMLPCVPIMMAGVSEGCRDSVAFALARHFRNEKKGFPEDATLAVLRLWNQSNKPPLDEATLTQKVIKAYHGGKNGKGYDGYSCDDDQIKPFCDPKCPIRENKEDPVRKKYFNGKTFIPLKLASELVGEYSFINSGEQLYVYQDGVYVPEGEVFIRKKCREKLRHESRINRVTEVLAHIIDTTYTEPDQLNNYKHLINLENGMLDWRKRVMLSHDKNYLSTMRIPVVYDPKATCPTVNYFLGSTLEQDCLELAEELFGYILIPDTSIHKAFMLTGGGANGKSTFLNLVEAFVGSENVAKVPLQDLDGHRFKRADLFGRLVNLFADLDSRGLVSSSYFKTVTAGDQLDAERKHKDPFYFRPFTRLIYSANEIPESPDKSFAFYRRWVIIPFPNTFTDKADKSLTNKLVQPRELSGLLNRALDGLRRLFDQGHFTESETVQAALESYKKENDSVDAFIQDRCDFSDPGAKVERKRLYGVYQRYCKQEGSNSVSRTVFYKHMRSQGISEVKGDQGKDLFVGIKLKDTSPQTGSLPGEVPKAS